MLKNKLKNIQNKIHGSFEHCHGKFMGLRFVSPIIITNNHISK